MGFVLVVVWKYEVDELEIPPNEAVRRTWYIRLQTDSIVGVYFWSALLNSQPSNFQRMIVQCGMLFLANFE